MCQIKSILIFIGYSSSTRKARPAHTDAVLRSQDDAKPGPPLGSSGEASLPCRLLVEYSFWVGWLVGLGFCCALFFKAVYGPTFFAVLCPLGSQYANSLPHPLMQFQSWSSFQFSSLALLLSTKDNTWPFVWEFHTCKQWDTIICPLHSSFLTSGFPSILLTLPPPGFLVGSFFLLIIH